MRRTNRCAVKRSNVQVQRKELSPKKSSWRTLVAVPIMTSKGNVGGIITEVHEVKTELKEKEEAEAMAGESVPPLDSGMPPEPLSKRYTRIFLVVCAYWTVSISMVFVNKRLLDTNAPLFVTWFQCVVTVAGCFAVQGLSARFPDYINFPRSEITKEKLLKVDIFLKSLLKRCEGKHMEKDIQSSPVFTKLQVFVKVSNKWLTSSCQSLTEFSMFLAYFFRLQRKVAVAMKMFTSVDNFASMKPLTYLLK